MNLKGFPKGFLSSEGVFNHFRKVANVVKIDGTFDPVAKTEAVMPSASALV